MLSTEKEHSMTRKEYLKQQKKSKIKFPLFKPILIIIVMIGLFAYVVHQLHVYNTVTEMANKVVEESKLIKTYKMYFMSKPYQKDQTENILYLYTGTDESRLELKEGVGLSNIQVFDDKLYGIKNGNLIRINTVTNELHTICEGDILSYAVATHGIYVYRYNKNDSKKTGIYKLGNEEKLIINSSINQLIVDENYIYIVTKDNTARTLIRYSLDGKDKKVLTQKIIVNNIVQDDKYIYYTNSSDNNKIYKVMKSGKESNFVTNNSCLVDNTKYNGNHIFGIYQGRVIFINSKDNKVYITGQDGEELLIDNEIKYLQLKDKMLYVSLKNKIEIYRFNLENSELEKITSARFSEFIFVNN